MNDKIQRLIFDIEKYLIKYQSQKISKIKNEELVSSLETSSITNFFTNQEEAQITSSIEIYINMFFSDNKIKTKFKLNKPEFLDRVQKYLIDSIRKLIDTKKADPNIIESYPEISNFREYLIEKIKIYTN